MPPKDSSATGCLGAIPQASSWHISILFTKPYHLTQGTRLERNTLYPGIRERIKSQNRYKVLENRKKKKKKVWYRRRRMPWINISLAPFHLHQHRCENTLHSMRMVGCLHSVTFKELLHPSWSYIYVPPTTIATNIFLF